MFSAANKSADAGTTTATYGKAMVA